MVSISRQVIRGNTISLEIDIFDYLGNRTDPDFIPEVAITDANDNTVRAYSQTDVVKVAEGRYRLNYSVSTSANVGIWTDHWRVVLNNITTTEKLYFSVFTQTADIEEADTIEIGDDPNIQYSQEEKRGINILLECLKYRLKNKTQVETIDAYGNIEYVDCYIFENEELVWFLKCSLSEFNQTPHFTDFTFAEPAIYERYGYIIVEGATILAWAAQMVIEAGRELSVTDNGITLQPPPLSNTLNNELSQFLTRHTEMLKHIKNNIKPRPLGFGGFRVLAVSPNYMRLRHLRQRRII